MKSFHLFLKSISSILFSSQLRVNIISGCLTTIINLCIWFAAYPIYLHYLGYERYGIWLVLGTILNFAFLGNLGINHAIMKLVAEEYGFDNQPGIERYVTSAIVIVFIIGLVILIFLLLFKKQIIALFNLSPDHSKIVSGLLPYIGALNLYVLLVQIINATLSGLGRMDLANYTNSAGRIITTATAVLLLFHGYGIQSLAVGTFFACLFVHIVSLVFIRRIARFRFLKSDNLRLSCCYRLISFGGGVLGSSLTSLLLHPMNKLILSRYTGVSVVPLYEIAYSGSMQIRGLFESGLRAIMPEISRIRACGGSPAARRIERLNFRAMKLILLTALPAYSLLAIFCPPLLRFWLGANYVDPLPVTFQIMLGASFLSLLGVPAFYTLMGIGKIRYNFLSQLIQGFLNVIMVGLLVIFTGTASLFSVTTAIAVAMGVTTLYILYRKHRALNTTESPIEEPISASPSRPIPSKEERNCFEPVQSSMPCSETTD